MLHSVYYSLAIFSRSHSVDGSRWVPFSKLGGERNEGGCVGGWTESSDNEGNWAQKLVLESSSRRDDPASVIKQREKGLITGFRDESAERSDIYYAGRVEVWTISSTLEVQGAGKVGSAGLQAGAGPSSGKKAVKSSVRTSRKRQPVGRPPTKLYKIFDSF